MFRDTAAGVNARSTPPTCRTCPFAEPARPAPADRHETNRVLTASGLHPVRVGKPVVKVTR